MTGPPVVAAPRGASPARSTYVRPAITSGVQHRPKRVMFYGEGGSGKTQLLSLVPDILIMDLEGGSSHLDVARLDMQGATYTDVRGALQDKELWAPYKAVGIDTVVRLQEISEPQTFATIKHEKGYTVDNIEGYGFGKGYQHLYDTFLPLLADLDRIIESGRHVILSCQITSKEEANPDGEDYLRFAPRLQHPKSNNASIRERVFEWCDIVGVIVYDVAAKDGKGKGAGTRTVHFSARPSWRAKGRGTFPKSIPWNDPTNATEVLKCLN